MKFKEVTCKFNYWTATIVCEFCERVETFGEKGMFNPSYDAMKIKDVMCLGCGKRAEDNSIEKELDKMSKTEQVKVVCPVCNGVGTNDEGPRHCNTCNGTKVLMCDLVPEKPECFRAKKAGKYFFVNANGAVNDAYESGNGGFFDDAVFQNRNYYQSEAQAKLGPEYVHAHSDYTYWHPGMPNVPNELPEGCEFWNIHSKWWSSKVVSRTSVWLSCTYRWPKTSPVEWVAL